MRVSSLSLLRCSVCSAGLSLHQRVRGTEDELVEGELICPSGHTFAVSESIPKLISSQLLMEGGDANKMMEAEFHDREALSQKADLVVDERHLYTWLNYYQLFDVLPLLRHLGPTSILVAMCGSGYEFDIWSRLTKTVWGMDVSFGALRNANQRARRLDLEGDVVVGDIEQMPFVDNAFDLVVIHHGLHHMPALESPLGEALRVSRQWCLVCEPVAGAMRRLFKFTRLSPAMEPGGTQVRDIPEGELKGIVASRSAKLALSKRLFYPRIRAPRPPAICGRADQIHLSTLLSLPLRSFNALFGAWLGTKGTYLISKQG